ncbi:MAG: Uma2 family endonuclease [Planctomycetes bacterium]|nr:Uma2 family endonuclease [Planctomycetota bacterium]
MIEYLGVPARRIRLHPPPGTATEEDVLRVQPWCELIDGVLVERAMGWYESRIAAVLIYFFEDFLQVHDLGIVLGADGMMRLQLGQVRIPDVAFYSWSLFPDREPPLEKILSAVPDLPVEVLSEGNTDKEMERKRREFFGGGTKLMWIVDPEKRTVDVYTSVDEFTTLTENDTLDGGAVLPGFTLSIKAWFEQAWKRA